MSTLRYFSGGRDPSGTRSVASQIMRIEMQKKGKLSSTDRFKLILKLKMAENKKKLAQKNTKPMSQRAERALEQVAAKKAAKEAKVLRQSVIIQPQVYTNGRLTKKGKIYDIAGNMVGEVNSKNGKIATILGTPLGKYKPKSMMTNALIEDAINRYSPHYINLRKLQMLQAAGIDPVTGQPLQSVINVHGAAAMHGGAPGSAFAPYGESAGGPRQNVGVTSWGAMSDNVWGTFADNAWGTSADNVWGTVSTDVWGGVGGNPFGKSVQFWGTGNGKNYIKGVTNFLAALFGFDKKNRQQNAQRLAQGRAASAPAARAPVSTGRR